MPANKAIPWAAPISVGGTNLDGTNLGDLDVYLCGWRCISVGSYLSPVSRWAAPSSNAYLGGWHLAGMNAS